MNTITKNNLLNDIELIYGKLSEKQGIITTKSDWFDESNTKRLKYGFDPHLNEDAYTLFFYWWDFIESKMSYSDFTDKLTCYFAEKYDKKVAKVNALYWGWERKENGNY
jgi:hypothetical protein